MDKKEQRIIEIMSELDCDIDVAEQMFFDEICDKYHTDDIGLAESLFYSE